MTKITERNESSSLLTVDKALIEQAIDTIGYYASVVGEDDQETPAKRAQAVLRAALAEPVVEPVAWEWRWLDTHPNTVTFGQWSEWKRVEPCNRLCTVEDSLNEFRAYIASGYQYELRALFTSPPPPVEVPEKTNAKESNADLDFYSDAAINEQRRNMVGEVAVGRSLGNGQHQSAGNSEPQGTVAVIAGFDEYGPFLGWNTHWVNFPVGTKLYTSPPPPAEPADHSQKGYKIVPIKPPEDALAVARRAYRNATVYDVAHVWHAIITALPNSLPPPPAEIDTVKPASVPLLTDDEIEREWQFLHDEEGNPPDQHDFARAIEQAVRQKAGLTNKPKE